MMILGSQMQEQEVGDGTNFVVILCGALLEQAEELIHMVCLIFELFTASKQFSLYFFVGINTYINC